MRNMFRTSDVEIDLLCQNSNIEFVFYSHLGTDSLIYSCWTCFHIFPDGQLIFTFECSYNNFIYFKIKIRIRIVIHSGNANLTVTCYTNTAELLKNHPSFVWGILKSSLILNSGLTPWYRTRRAVDMYTFILEFELICIFWTQIFLHFSLFIVNLRSFAKSPPL